METVRWPTRHAAAWHKSLQADTLAQANAIYMNVPSQRGDDNQIVRSMSGWWISAQLLQVAWTLAFAQEQISLSCGLMYAPPTTAPRYATPRLRHTACPSF